MKKIFVAVVVVAMGLLIMTPVASAYPVSAGDQITITDGFGRANGGGTFDISISSGGPLFDTFCLERDEYINVGGSYYIGSITNGAKDGGLAGYTDNYDPISSETAYLYSRWATGAIFNNDYNANALQLAIWRFEDEWVGGTTTLPNWNSTTNQQVISARAFYDDAVINHNGTLYGVAVMNLYNSYNSQTHMYTGNAQDMLVYNAVPEPATMLLLGLGLIGLVGARRITKRK